MTAAELLDFFIANPVGIRDGSELQKGFGVDGGIISSSSVLTRKAENIYSDNDSI